MELAFLDLLNTEWRDWRGSGQEGDRLDQPDTLEKLLSTWDLNTPEVDRATLPPALKELRARIRPLMEKAAHNEPLTESDWATLDSYMLGATYRRKIVILSASDDGDSGDRKTAGPGPFERSMEWEPVSRNADWVLARITESFVQVLIRGDSRRLKICANADCGWAFYDNSRAMTRTWCDSRSCGNLMKVRRFRERHKDEDRSSSHSDGK